MPDAFMPDVEVHIAFNAGYTTPAASRTWTDVSTYVELADRISIAFGRQDERSTADANRLTLTLDNSDGRFTAMRAASTYYPNVKVGRPIRVRVTPPGGSVVTRFVGFIDEWPVEWDGTDEYAKTTITATSRLARLGLGARLRSAIEQEVLGPRPIAYYTLGDASGSTSAVDSAGRGIGSLTDTPADPAISPNHPTFGNAIGVGSDGLTAMEFPTDSTSYRVTFPAQTVKSFRLCFLSESGDFGNGLGFVSGGGSSMVLGQYGNLDTLSYGVYGGVFASGLEGGSATPGELHDLVVTSSVADGARLYLDGVEVDTGAGTDYADMTALTLGTQNNDRTFTLCHAAIYDVILTPEQVAAQASAALSGHEGDTTDERLLRILGWAGVAETEVDADAGAETMTYQQTSGQSIVEALRDVESTENGVLFDGTDGQVVFHNRSRRYDAEVAATLDMDAQHVGTDYAPKLDRSTLANDVEAENPTTEEVARAVDTDSSDEYGIATRSVTVVADTYDALAQRASWEVAAYAEPRSRVPSLTVDVLAHVDLTPSAEDLLGLGVGDLLAVTNAPTQADSSDASYFIEGYTETIGPESWEISFNLSPSHPSLSTFVIEDATRGELDSSFVLAH